MLMEGSQGSPGKGRPLARPAVGPVPAPQAPPSLALFCLRRFGCCPVGLYVSAPARLAPPSSGPAVQEMSLRRSFVADFLRESPAPCLAGRQASVGHSSASFASSQNNGGEGKLAGHQSRPTHRQLVHASTRFQPLDRHRSVGEGPTAGPPHTRTPPAKRSTP